MLLVVLGELRRIEGTAVDLDQTLVGVARDNRRIDFVFLDRSFLHFAKLADLDLFAALEERVLRLKRAIGTQARLDLRRKRSRVGQRPVSAVCADPRADVPIRMQRMRTIPGPSFPETAPTSKGRRESGRLRADDRRCTTIILRDPYAVRRCATVPGLRGDPRRSGMPELWLRSVRVPDALGEARGAALTAACARSAPELGTRADPRPTPSISRPGAESSRAPPPAGRGKAVTRGLLGLAAMGLAGWAFQRVGRSARKAADESKQSGRGQVDVWA